MVVITQDAPGRRGLGLLLPSAISLGAAVLGAGVNLALAVLIGRAYGAAETGTFFAIIGVFLVAANTLKLGADTGLVRMLSRAVALGRPAQIVPTVVSALWPVLVVAGLVATIAYGGADALADALRPHDAARTASMIRYLAIALPLMAVFALATAVARGLGGIGAFALQQNVALPLTRLAGVLVAVWLGQSIVVATQWWAGGLPVLVVVALAVAVRAVRRVPLTRADGLDQAPRPEPAPEAGVFAAFWRFSLPRAASAAIEIVLEWLDVILVSILAGPAQAGVYAVATRLVKVSSIADYALRVALSTRLSAALATGDVDAVRRIYELGTRLLVALVWPYLAVLLVFGDVAARVFGGDFAGATALVAILAGGMAVVAGAGSLQSVLLLSGLSRQQLTNKIVVLSLIHI